MSQPHEFFMHAVRTPDGEYWTVTAGSNPQSEISKVTDHNLQTALLRSAAATAQFIQFLEDENLPKPHLPRA